MAELKAISDDGKLTTDKIIQGLERSKKSVDGAMQKIFLLQQKNGWEG